METVIEKINWEELVSESYYETIWAIEQQIKAFDNEEALVGLHYLYENMSKRDRREFRSFLMLLMIHIIKWKHQPEKRSRSWVRTIHYAREEISDKREDIPTLTNEYILSVWEKCFERATENAKIEMLIPRKQDFLPQPLTWQEIFEDEYCLEDDN